MGEIEGIDPEEAEGEGDHEQGHPCAKPGRRLERAKGESCKDAEESEDSVGERDAESVGDACPAATLFVGAESEHHEGHGDEWQDAGGEIEEDTADKGESDPCPEGASRGAHSLGGASFEEGYDV